MGWLFLIVVCGISALVSLDSYVHELEKRRYISKHPLHARRSVFRRCVKSFKNWCRRLLTNITRNLSIVLISNVFIILFIAFVLFFLLYILPLAGSLYELMSYQIDNIRIGDDAFRNASLSIAGSITLFIALLGVVLTVIRSILTRQQNDTAQQKIVGEQISRAIDQIGTYKQDVNGAQNEINIEVRLGGLYSLQRIMEDSLRDMLPIARIIYAYVRENVKRDRVKKEGQKHVALPEDIEAALKITSQFNKEWKKRFGDFPKDKQLNLSRADFTKYSLTGMDFSNTILEYTNFTDADLYYANLSNAYLYFSNLSNVKLYYANLSGADLSGVNLVKAYLVSANLSGADLSGANLSGANLADVNLYDARLSGAKLSETVLSGANLSRAYLYDANLSGADLEWANLSDARLYGANLSKTRYLTQEQIDTAYGNKETILPDNITRPDSWKEGYDWSKHD